MRLQYRIKSDSWGFKHLQFKRKGTWRYIPSHYVAGVFSLAWCPFYLPFSTSHCYLVHLEESSAITFAEKYPNEEDLQDYLQSLKQEMYNKTQKITYLP